MRTAFGLEQATHRLMLLLAIVACQFVPRTLAAETANTGPKIAAARIGLKNHYKLGVWTPVSVDVENVAAAETAKNLRADVTVADSDGVATTASAPLSTRTASDGRRSVVVYTQVGRVDSPIRVSLVDGDRQLDELTLLSTAKAKPEVAVVPIAATSELIVSLGTSPYGLTDAFANRAASDNQVGRKLIELDSIAVLPTHWYGYDAVDVLLIPVGDGRLCRELANDKTRFAALESWVQLGGRLVILCDGKNAQAMLGPNGPLAALAPGKLAEVVRLPEISALEHFAASTAPIAGPAIEVPRLVDVQGNIDVYAGRRPTDLPLVVRATRGFGEIIFVGVELSQPPLAAWSGRTAFLRTLLRPYLPDAVASDSTQKLVTSGFYDLSGALRQRLGRRFALVVPIGFPIVAGLAIAYLCFLGPLDYLIIHRWLRRPLMAWITFPIIVAAFSIVALAVGNLSRGSAGTRVNRLELVDFDTITGQVRGTFWATVYSPVADRFDFAIKLPTTAMEPPSTAEILFSWWGLPGIGIGGMQTSGSDLGIIRRGYRYGSNGNSLEQVPVLASATKSLLARWSGTSPVKIDAQLTAEDGLVVGTIANQTGSPLRNARLLYGSWAYRLGNLNAGERIEVGEQLSPRRAKTIVTRDALGESGAAVIQVEGRIFSAEQASAKDILSLMMFYETAGGFGFAHVPNRYQAYCDLSRQLDLGRAVLVADTTTPGAARRRPNGTIRWRRPARYVGGRLSVCVAGTTAKYSLASAATPSLPGKRLN